MDVEMDRREERVLFETERYRVSGTLTLARGGYRSRVSDVLNASERSFIPLTDVILEPLNGSGEASHYPFLALAREHIVYAVAVDE